MFTWCTASAVLECRLETGCGSLESCRVACRLAVVWSLRNRGGAYPARNWRRRNRCGLRLGGGTEVVGMVYGEIKTSPGFCRSYYGDVVLVEARRLSCVWCRLETGGGISESCRVECRLAIVWSIRNRGDAYLETGE